MKPNYTIVSFSGGKDSTAMLLHMLEIGEHIDEVINVDTGMEFPAMYDHINQIEQVVIDHGVKAIKHIQQWIDYDLAFVRYNNGFKYVGFSKEVL